MNAGSTAAPQVSMTEATRRQRLVVVAAGVAAVVALMLGGGLGNWLAGLFGALGVGLGLANALLTEASMIRMTTAGRKLSRKQFAVSAFGRLAAISLVALILVFAFWPAGGFVLAGLAVFQLLTIVLTALPLLKELRQS
ncbi:MAG: synthase chain [Nocardioidaceae bacterium]|jgi:O-antigen/teichoic acid export membrane protein|nr:synthase chain [Nocardioidaceae bacterium]